MSEWARSANKSGQSGQIQSSQSSHSERYNSRTTRAFGDDIDHFKNNRDCIFVPIASQSVNRPTTAFGPHIPMPVIPGTHRDSAYNTGNGEPTRSKDSDAGSSVGNYERHGDTYEAYHYTTICGVSLRTIDGLSSIQSFILFLLACVFATNGAKYVDLWEQVLIIHNSTEVEHLSKSFATQMNHWCLDIPRIPQLTAYGFPALPVIVNDFKVNLWLLNIPIFFTSMLFQGYRYFAANKPILGFGQYNPTTGADIGRWVEYMLTSPLQVVLVAIAYHIRDDSQLWSLAFMQAMLVLMGYCIEREAYWWQTGNFHFKFEHNALIILVASSWLLHIIIWLKIIMSRWLLEVQVMDTCSAKTFGLGDSEVGVHTHWATTTHTSNDVLTVDAYGLTHDASHSNNRDKNLNWKSRKIIIDLLFATQFIFFTLFGIVNLLTIWSIRRQVRDGVSGTPNSIHNVWGTATKRYSILSIVVKTLLEIFFFVYVLQNPSGMD